MATILVIEDDEQLRRWLRILLESKGYSVLEAEDGNKAFTCIDRERPDLIVLDIVLPDKEGLETLSDLRKRGLAIKVLAISGNPFKGFDTCGWARMFGASEALAKPFTAAVFLARVEALLTSV